MMHSIPTQDVKTIFANRKIYQLNNENKFKQVISNNLKKYSLHINEEKGVYHDCGAKIKDSLEREIGTILCNVM